MSENCSESVASDKINEEIELEEPPRYQVLMHNDNYTAMEFVVLVLQHVFHKNLDEATKLMLSVHNFGIGRCGVFTAEVARSKVARVHIEARRAGYPLTCTLEKV